LFLFTFFITSTAVWDSPSGLINIMLLKNRIKDEEKASFIPVKF
jgi:hypothetical protein